MPIPDEKARAWTRPEDYWPPRRLRRSGRAAINRFRPAASEEDEPRPGPLLSLLPYAALMIALAVLAIAIIALAWPGSSVSPDKPASEAAAAPKG